MQLFTKDEQSSIKGLVKRECNSTYSRLYYIQFGYSTLPLVAWLGRTLRRVSKVSRKHLPLEFPVRGSPCAHPIDSPLLYMSLRGATFATTLPDTVRLKPYQSKCVPY